MRVLGVPPALAVLLARALVTSLGFGNAAMVVWTHLNSFIVTLATASLITGGMLILTRARPFSNLPDSFLGIAQIELGGVPVAPLVLIMLAVALVLGLVYRRSEEHTSELQSRSDIVCRLLLGKKKHGIVHS